MCLYNMLSQDLVYVHDAIEMVPIIDLQAGHKLVLKFYILIRYAIRIWKTYI